MVRLVIWKEKISWENWIDDKECKAYIYGLTSPDTDPFYLSHIITPDSLLIH